jgi:hypothetical protein
VKNLDEYYEKRKKLEAKAKKIYESYRKRAKWGIPITIVIFAVLISAFHISYAINVEYRYNKNIGAYIENAYDASIFELMKENYILAKQGMVNEGLQPSDYGKFWFWEQTPDWQMAYTYQYINGLITRCDFYINQTETLEINQFTDIYNQMITNMREESLRNGPIDWAAKPAFILKASVLYYFGGLVWIVALVVSVLVILMFWLPLRFSEYDIEIKLREAEET